MGPQIHIFLLDWDHCQIVFSCHLRKLIFPSTFTLSFYAFYPLREDDRGHQKLMISSAFTSTSTQVHLQSWKQLICLFKANVCTHTSDPIPSELCSVSYLYFFHLPDLPLQWFFSSQSIKEVQVFLWKKKKKVTFPSRCYPSALFVFKTNFMCRTVHICFHSFLTFKSHLNLSHLSLAPPLGRTCLLSSVVS